MEGHGLMPKGLRFFGTNFNHVIFGGTITASSADAKKAFAFDGLISTRWISSGENTDGDQIQLEMDYGANRTVDSFYVYNTNILDIIIQYWNGAAWVAVDTTNATIVKSSDNRYVFASLTAAVTTQKVRIIGEDTITADQEKQVTLFYAFEEIGQFEYFPELNSFIEPFQSVYKLDNGKNFVIERGEFFRAIISFRSHVNQNDIDLATTLLERKEPFYIWPNGGDADGIFTYAFSPYRFKDIFKVAVIKPSNPSYTKGYYKAGYNNNIQVLEVA